MFMLPHISIISSEKCYYHGKWCFVTTLGFGRHKTVFIDSLQVSLFYILDYLLTFLLLTFKTVKLKGCQIGCFGSSFRSICKRKCMYCASWNGYDWNMSTVVVQDLSLLLPITYTQRL